MRRLSYLCLLLVCLTGASALGGEIRGVIKPADPDLQIELWTSMRGTFPARYVRDVDLDPKTGEFRFTKVSAGTYDLSIYGWGLRLVGRTIRNIKMGGGVVDVGEITLQPSAWITGTIDPPDTETRISIDGDGLIDPWIDCNGAFEITGIPPGTYKVTFSRDDFEDYSTTVEVKSVSEYKIGHITLVKRGVIEGKITLEGKPPAAYAKGIDGQPFSVGACRIGDPKPEGLSNYRDGKVRPTGEYTISDLNPGRYDIAINAHGTIVMGISSLPADAAGTSESDRTAIQGIIDQLAQAFAKGDLAAIRRLATKDCMFLLDPEADLKRIAGRMDELSKMGKHVPLILRAGKNEAVAYTRTDAPIEDKNFDQDLAKKVRWEYVEFWKLRRIGGTWKLAAYGWDPELSFMVTWMRLGVLENQQDTKTIPPPANLILTDDPRLTNFEVKTGEVSTGHDWTIKFE